MYSGRCPGVFVQEPDIRHNSHNKVNKIIIMYNNNSNVFKNVIDQYWQRRNISDFSSQIDGIGSSSSKVVE